MMSDVQVSVVVPVWNAEPFLPLLLESLLNQTERSLQIVAVDDESTDNSQVILREFARRDSRLLVLSQPRRGVAAARNLALSHAVGRWVAFADHDDWLAPDALRTWRLRAEADDLDLTIGNGFRFTSDPVAEKCSQRPLLKLQPWEEVIRGVDWIIHRVKVQELNHFIWLQLARRSLLVEHGLRCHEGYTCDDTLWTMHVALVARRVGFVREPLYGYRSNPTSITKSRCQDRVVHRIKSCFEAMEQLAAMADTQAAYPAVRDALLREANSMAGQVKTHLQRSLEDPALRGQLAHEFFERGLSRIMLRGSLRIREAWRAARCWTTLQKHMALARIAA